ncbi:MAG: guanylate kinase [Candidatus Omnitrophota bacterium]
MKANKSQRRLGKIFVICGPSGSGKTTLLASLIKDKKIGKLLVKSCSITTRPERSGEKDKVEYFFVSAIEFKYLLKAKKILEWTRYLGYYYGTPKGPLERQFNDGKHVGLCLDLKGARILKKLYPNNTVTIFILPPSLAELKSRIENRCSQTNKNEVARRIRLARGELLAAKEFDYSVLNQNLQVALRELKDIFLHEINA